MGALFRPIRIGGKALFATEYHVGGVGAPDSMPPVMVGSLTITEVLPRSLTVAWLTATDNMAVVGYQVSVDTGTPTYISVGNVLTRGITGLIPDTDYVVRVRAVDAAGNASPALTALVSTPVEIKPERVPVFGTIGDGALVLEFAVLSNDAIPLEFLRGRGQEIILVNRGDTDAVVNIRGSEATVVEVRGAAGRIVDVSGGLNITVPAGKITTLKLDNAIRYLKGEVTVKCDVEQSVFAGVLQ